MLLVLSFWFHKKRSAGKRFETRRGAGENTFSYKVFSPALIPFTFLLKMVHGVGLEPTRFEGDGT